MSWSKLLVVADVTEPNVREPCARGDGGVVLVVGDGRLMVHEMVGDRIVIGRAPERDLALEHRELSRRHAMLIRRPELAIQDLGSTNGVRVAGAVVRGGAPVPVARGETFHIGPFSFLVAEALAKAPSTGRSSDERLVVDDPTPEGVSP